MSGHFGRVGDCLVAGFSVPFAVSFTFVLRWWPKKQRWSFVNHLHSWLETTTLALCLTGDRFGAFVASSSMNADLGLLPRDLSGSFLIIHQFFSCNGMQTKLPLFVSGRQGLVSLYLVYCCM